MNKRASMLAVAILVAVAGCSAPSDSAPDNPEAEPAWRELAMEPDSAIQSEVSIAVSPVNPGEFIAASNRLGTIAFFQGNQSVVDTSVVYRLDAVGPTGLAYTSIGDPIVAYSSDGTPHLGGLAVLPGSAIFVTKLVDGQWQPSVVFQSEPGATFNDKPWMAINHQTDTIHVAWQNEPALDQLRGVEQTVGVGDLDVGQIFYSKSTDGQTWSLPEILGRGLHNNGTQLGVDGAGNVHLVYVNYEEGTIDWQISSDDGDTWSSPEAVADVDIVGSYDRFPRMHTLPALATSPRSLDAHVVYHGDPAGDADIFIASYNGTQQQWQPQLRVPAGEAGDGTIQFYPWAAINRDLDVEIGFYHQVADGPQFQYAGTTFDPASKQFAPITLVSSQPFAPFASDEGPASLGDYTGVASGGGFTYFAWADARDGDSYVQIAVKHE